MCIDKIHQNRILIIVTLVSFLICACKKNETLEVSPSNTETEAKNDIKLVEQTTSDLLGNYAVKDSLTGPPTLEWYYSAYNLEIRKSNCDSTSYVISNYANLNQNSNNIMYNASCSINKDSLIISNQKIHDISIRNTSGYFLNDSVFFEIEYENQFGEVFYGNCYGIKK